MSGVNNNFLTPALTLRDAMAQLWYTTESAEVFSGAFGRIAQPYSGAAPRKELTAKLVRGVGASKLALSLAKNL